MRAIIALLMSCTVWLMPVIRWDLISGYDDWIRAAASRENPYWIFCHVVYGLIIQWLVCRLFLWVFRRSILTALIGLPLIFVLGDLMMQTGFSYSCMYFDPPASPSAPKNPVAATIEQ